jgi:hypothetical protein
MHGMGRYITLTASREAKEARKWDLFLRKSRYM